jgi:hypothetical protein
LFSPPPIDKIQKELKEEILNKIVKNRFFQFQDSVNYRDKEKYINFQNEKFKEFQQIEKKSGSYYDVPKLVNFISDVFLIENYRRPSYAIAIPAKAEDCYNLIEYQVYYSMKNIINKFGYGIVPNSHVHNFNSLKIVSESYRVPDLRFIFFKS